MTAKIRRENSRMTYQRIQREKELKRETRNAGENVEDYKRETKCKRIKDVEMKTHALHLTFTRGCLTFNPRTRFLYYTNKVKLTRSYLALNAECECEVKDK